MNRIGLLLSSFVLKYVPYVYNVPSFLTRDVSISLFDLGHLSLLRVTISHLHSSVTPAHAAMSTDASLLLPPPAVRGMMVLNKELFSKTITVPALAVDINSIKVISKKGPLKKYLLRLDNFKPLQNLDGTANANLAIDKELISENSTKKVVIFNPKLVHSFNDIQTNDRQLIASMGITEQALHFFKLRLVYDNWKPDEILRAVLPEDKDSVASYSMIGHIIHLNLRDHFVEYKHLIGQVLLDKIPGARTIVNKLDIIDNTYRNFQMEILGGEKDMMAQVRENYCTFEFDFSSVYWNPRLCTEHERIVKLLNPGDILYDVFAGVGPFAIPAAKKKCSVLANDLNPESYKWLKHNAKINKVLSSVRTFNKDGADFIKEDVKKDMIERWKILGNTNNSMHITMNLPALAETFLSGLYGLFTLDEIEPYEIQNYPIVHLYCFTKGNEPVQLALEKVENNLGVKLTEEMTKEILNVRNVSPQKEMMRISFVLSREILIGSFPKITRVKSAETCSEGPPSKKLCSIKNVSINDGEKEGTQFTSRQQEKQ